MMTFYFTLTLCLLSLISAESSQNSVDRWTFHGDGRCENDQFPLNIAAPEEFSFDGTYAPEGSMYHLERTTLEYCGELCLEQPWCAFFSWKAESENSAGTAWCYISAHCELFSGDNNGFDNDSWKYDTYVITGRNQDLFVVASTLDKCNPDALITTSGDCQKAATALGAIWDGDRNWNDRPFGCLMTTGDNEVNFNQNTQGIKSNPDQDVICYKRVDLVVTQIGDHERCREGHWLNVFPSSALECAYIVSNNPSCDNRYFSWANYNDNNCWCAEVGTDCKNNLAPHEVVTTWEISTGTSEYQLLFRQTLPYLYAQNELRLNPENPSSDNYAILDELERFRREDGRFYFRMVWPGDDIVYEWSQTSNPVSESVEGYEAISVPFTGRYWGGLEPSTAALMDGSVNSGNWFYAVGSHRLWNGGIPSYAKANNDAGYPQQAVELYVNSPVESTDGSVRINKVRSQQCKINGHWGLTSINYGPVNTAEQCWEQISNVNNCNQKFFTWSPTTKSCFCYADLTATHHSCTQYVTSYGHETFEVIDTASKVINYDDCTTIDSVTGPHYEVDPEDWETTCPENTAVVSVETMETEPHNQYWSIAKMQCCPLVDKITGSQYRIPELIGGVPNYLQGGGSSSVEDQWEAQCPPNAVMVGIYDNDDNGDFDDIDATKCNTLYCPYTCGEKIDNDDCVVVNLSPASLSSCPIDYVMVGLWDDADTFFSRVRKMKCCRVLESIPPTASPTQMPTTDDPSQCPTASPTTSIPSMSPTTNEPTLYPSQNPTTEQPTDAPSLTPSTEEPSISPSRCPTFSDPTYYPSKSPSKSPTTDSPTLLPTISPSTDQPTKFPSTSPTTEDPSLFPTMPPSTDSPTKSPSQNPTTEEPTAFPTTEEPSLFPTMPPSTDSPTKSPSQNPTTEEPTAFPSTPPTYAPTLCEPTCRSHADQMVNFLDLMLDFNTVLLERVKFRRSDEPLQIALDEMILHLRRLKDHMNIVHDDLMPFIPPVH